MAFKLKKIPADGGTEQNGGDKVEDTEGAKKEGSSNTTEKLSKGNEEKAPEDNKVDVSEEQSDGVEEVKGVAAGETTQSVDKDDKSPSDNAEDIISREDIKEEFTKFGTVRVIYMLIPFCFVLYHW